MQCKFRSTLGVPTSRGASSGLAPSHPTLKNWGEGGRRVGIYCSQHKVRSNIDVLKICNSYSIHRIAPFHAVSHISCRLPKQPLARSGYVELVLVAMVLPPIAPPPTRILEASPIWNLRVGPTRWHRICFCVFVLPSEASVGPEWLCGTASGNGFAPDCPAAQSYKTTRLS